jgi:hypothetical protein
LFRVVIDGAPPGTYLEEPEATEPIAEPEATVPAPGAYRGPYDYFPVPPRSVAIDDIGRVAYVVDFVDFADLQGNQPARRDEILVSSDGGAPVPFVTSDGPFQLFSNVHLGDDGTIAFYATLDNGTEGIFKGPDAVRDKVIATGDTNGGRKVDGVVSLFDLNDKGQVAFGGSFADRGILEYDSVYQSDGAKASSLKVLAPDAHTVQDQKYSQSAFVGLEGV